MTLSDKIEGRVENSTYNQGWIKFKDVKEFIQEFKIEMGKDWKNLMEDGGQLGLPVNRIIEIIDKLAGSVLVHSQQETSTRKNEEPNRHGNYTPAGNHSQHDKVLSEEESSADGSSSGTSCSICGELEYEGLRHFCPGSDKKGCTKPTKRFLSLTGGSKKDRKEFIKEWNKLDAK